MHFSRPFGISGPTLWLPERRQSASEAVRQGLIDSETAEELGHSALPVADQAAPDLAVEAARRALADAGLDAGSVALLLHAWIHYQGHDLWSPPHYIADRLDADAATPIGIQQVCNGGAAALELAAARLLAEPELGAALITTADRFADPGFDRWSGDYGIGYGDGATALVLHDPGLRPADLLLHSIATVAAPQLERMHRGDDPFGPAPRSISERVDVRRTKKAFLQAEGIEGFGKASAEALRRVASACLEAPALQVSGARLRYVVPPRLGRKTIDLAYAPVLGELDGAELLRVGQDTGHLGAGDLAASLAELRSGRLLSRGEYALVVSAGAGFTWSGVLVGATV
ncbi:3-oxoacyl-[acyl-carrier-protein] synthase III C-terminal domain-containing protein [Streptomyces sp. NPDC048710]|uniref:3-oxoacyl-[acyl-carrier-protein] synthase III C-terminal domain-containing protein n=1 Tax=unclassified Streptomyces TaxID=2593676 RepID=UPI00371D9376